MRLDADRGRPDRRHQQAEREQRGEDEADHRILAQPRVLLDEPHGERRQDAGEERADRERKAEDVGAGDAGHDRVGQRVAHQRPALEHQVGGEERAHAADQRAHPHGLDHVVVAERHEQLGDQLGSSSRPALPTAASSLVALAVEHQRPLVVGEHGQAPCVLRRRAAPRRPG